MRYEFRPCAAEDRDWAYALKSDAYRDVSERQFGPWNEEFQRALFASRWNPEKSRVIAVEGAPVGLIVLENSNDEWWLGEIQLVREWRGRGLGGIIIRDLLVQARADRKPLRLQVLQANHRAEAFYRRLGFIVTGESETHRRMECR